MDFKGNFIKALVDENGAYEITFRTTDKKAVMDLRLQGCQQELDVKATKHREKRSLNANAYFWKLLGDLAKQMHTSTSELYAHYVKDFGVSTIVGVKNDALEAFTRSWTEKGDAWLVNDLGATANGKGRNLQLFYGSSTYNTEEMSRLIEAVVDDCKQVGIETKTPAELAEMMSLWGSAK